MSPRTGPDVQARHIKAPGNTPNKETPSTGTRPPSAASCGRILSEKEKGQSFVFRPWPGGFIGLRACRKGSNTVCLQGNLLFDGGCLNKPHGLHGVANASIEARSCFVLSAFGGKTKPPALWVVVDRFVSRLRSTAARQTPRPLVGQLHYS